VQVVGYILAESQVLLLALDVVNTREDTNLDMRMFWYINQMSSLFFMTIILPFCLFYAQADESKDFVSDLSTLTFVSLEMAAIISL
jgi:hypothetical protein